MNINNLDPNDLMIRGVSLFGKARSLKGISKIVALNELRKGARLMNRSVDLAPHILENRMTRLRHMLGATIRSPRKFHKEVRSDIDYIDGVLETLTNEERSNFLCAKGEYFHFLGEKEKGIKLILEASKTSPDSFIGQYSRVMHEKLLNDMD